MEISKEKKRADVSQFFCFFFFSSLKKLFFWGKRSKNGAEGRQPRVLLTVVGFDREKNNRWCQNMSLSIFSFLFFYENTYVLKKKNNNNLIFFSPHHWYQSIYQWCFSMSYRLSLDITSRRTDRSHPVVQIDHIPSYRSITSCRTTWRRIWTSSWWRFRQCRRTWRSWREKWKSRATLSRSIVQACSRRCSGSGPWPSRQTSW